MIGLSLLLALAAGAPTAPEIDQGPATHRWPDGLSLVVQPVPGARTASLRIAVRAGGFLDPVGKAGLAHMVEHVLLEGPVGVELIRDARAARATVNAFTSGSWTLYVLDAPAERFPVLAERYLKLVTSPDFLLAKIPKQRDVIAQEAVFRGVSAEMSLLDGALFPAPTQGGPLIGTGSSRGDFRVEDVRKYFLDYYVPPLTTIVMTGAIALEDGVQLVERGYLVPPVAAPPTPAPDILNLPLDQHVPSLLTLVAQGYVLDPADREVCPALAALLELRLILAVREAGPRVPHVGAACQRLRGRDLLVALAYTTTLDAPELPDGVDAVFSTLGRAPPTREEQALVLSRLARHRERVLADPVALADALALQVAEVGTAEVQQGLAAARLPPWSRLREAATRSLRRELRFQLEFTPRE